MLCPTDGAMLVMSERGGIEIDYCPQCRGVWLDRGELDKLIERSAQQEQASALPRDEQPRYEQSRHAQPRYEAGSRHDKYDKYSNPGYPRKKRKENWLSELFD